MGFSIFKQYSLEVSSKLAISNITVPTMAFTFSGSISKALAKAALALSTYSERQSGIENESMMHTKKVYATTTIRTCPSRQQLSRNPTRSATTLCSGAM
jgi:hypothetical protein